MSQLLSVEYEDVGNSATESAADQWVVVRQDKQGHVSVVHTSKSKTLATRTAQGMNQDPANKGAKFTVENADDLK